MDKVESNLEASLTASIGVESASFLSSLGIEAVFLANKFDSFLDIFPETWARKLGARNRDLSPH